MKRLFICLLLLVPVMTFAGCSEGNDEHRPKLRILLTIRGTMKITMTARERLNPGMEKF